MKFNSSCSLEHLSNVLMDGLSSALPCVSLTGFQVFVPPPPHAGAALLSALNILEGFNITNQVSRSSIYHWIAEVLHCNQHNSRYISIDLWL